MNCKIYYLSQFLFFENFEKKIIELLETLRDLDLSPAKIAK